MESANKRRKVADQGGDEVREYAEDLNGDEEAPVPSISFKDAFSKLPAHFRAYLKANGVPEDAYDVPSLSRFVRFVPNSSKSALSPWLPSFLGHCTT